jgi:hypothetical protein
MMKAENFSSRPATPLILLEKDFFSDSSKITRQNPDNIGPAAVGISIVN